MAAFAVRLGDVCELTQSAPTHTVATLRNGRRIAADTTGCRHARRRRRVSLWEGKHAQGGVASTGLPVNEARKSAWAVEIMTATASGLDMPKPFLEVVVHELQDEPSLTALCVCYELGLWRYEAFAKHLFEWLPEFALSWPERQTFKDSTSVELLRRAAAVVYESEKYEKRGEFGELILHAIVRQVFQSEPAISKIFFKDSVNITVKGFDAVHVVAAGDDLELWLGEAKFYNDISKAISAVVAELEEHLHADYLRTEFSLIVNKLPDGWQHTQSIKALLHPNTSLDMVFKSITVPVLLTYDSPTVASHSVHENKYAEEFEAEVRKHWATFAAKELPTNVRIRLLLLPLYEKATLLKQLDGLLKTWQSI